MIINLQNIIISFPALFVAESVLGSQPKFGGKFVIDPANTALVAALDKAINDAAKETWGEKAEAYTKQFVRTGRKPDVFFVKEPYTNKDGEVYKGFDGKYYVTATNPARPRIIGPRKEVITADDGKPLAGDVVNIQIDVWAQDNKFGRAVRATLLVVQFVKTGDRLGGGAAADLSAFGEVAEEDFV